MISLSNIGILSAFSVGMASFLSPCVLPLVPGLSYIAGRSSELLQANESLIRIASFFVIFVAMAAWEAAVPRRQRKLSRLLRWSNNLGQVLSVVPVTGCAQTGGGPRHGPILLKGGLLLPKSPSSAAAFYC